MVTQLSTSPTREQIVAWWAQPINITDRDTPQRRAMDAAMQAQFQALYHDGVWFQTGQGGFRLRVFRRHDARAVAGEVTFALPHIIPFAHAQASDLGLVKVVQLLEHNLSADGVYWLMADASDRYHVMCSRQSVARQSFDTLVEAIGYIQANHWAIDYTKTSIEEQD